MRAYALVLLICFALSSPLYAQSKNELGLTLGVESIPQSSVSGGGTLTFSRSVAFGFSYARHLTGERTELQVEFPFAAAPRHDITAAQTAAIQNIATLYETPSLRVRFANRSRISPWISGGFGYGLYEGSQLLRSGARNPSVFRHSGTVQFGGGVDLRTPLRILFPVSFRAEVRDFYTLDGPNFDVVVKNNGQHNVIAAGGFVIKF